LRIVPTFEESSGNTYTTDLGKRERKKKCMVSAWSGKISIPLICTDSSTNNMI